jgi:hypothetical protein
VLTAATLTSDPWGGEERTLLQPQGDYNHRGKSVRGVVKGNRSNLAYSTISLV